MARIKDYQLDRELELQDKVLGTDVTNNGTMNFSLEQLGEFLASRGLAEPSNLDFQFTYAGNTAPSSFQPGEIYFNSEEPASLTEVYISSADLKGIDTGPLVRVLAGTVIELNDAKTSEGTDYGFYNVDSVDTTTFLDGYMIGVSLYPNQASTMSVPQTDSVNLSLVGLAGGSGTIGYTPTFLTQSPAQEADGEATIRYVVDGNAPADFTLQIPDGPAGDKGDMGTRGSIWSSAPGPPSVLGTELAGDQYLDTTSEDVYEFNGTSWVDTGNIGPNDDITRVFTWDNTALYQVDDLVVFDGELFEVHTAYPGTAAGNASPFHLPEFFRSISTIVTEVDTLDALEKLNSDTSVLEIGQIVTIDGEGVFMVTDFDSAGTSAVRIDNLDTAFNISATGADFNDGTVTRSGVLEALAAGTNTTFRIEEDSATGKNTLYIDNNAVSGNVPSGTQGQVLGYDASNDPTPVSFSGTTGTSGTDYVVEFTSDASGITAKVNIPSSMGTGVFVQSGTLSATPASVASFNTSHNITFTAVIQVIGAFDDPTLVIDGAEVPTTATGTGGTITLTHNASYVLNANGSRSFAVLLRDSTLTDDFDLGSDSVSLGAPSPGSPNLTVTLSGGTPSGFGNNSQFEIGTSGTYTPTGTDGNANGWNTPGHVLNPSTPFVFDATDNFGRTFGISQEFTAPSGGYNDITRASNTIISAIRSIRYGLRATAPDEAYLDDVSNFTSGTMNVLDFGDTNPFNQTITYTFPDSNPYFVYVAYDSSNTNNLSSVIDSSMFENNNAFTLVTDGKWKIYRTMVAIGGLSSLTYTYS